MKLDRSGPKMRMITITSMKAHALPRTIDECLAKTRNKSFMMQTSRVFLFPLSVFLSDFHFVVWLILTNFLAC